MVAPAHTTEAESAPGAAGRRRTWLTTAGVVLLVVGVVAGIGLWVAAAQRLDDAVGRLARAPVDCTTTLNFSETGEFLIFVETQGELEGVRGDCDAAGEFDYTGDEPPAVTLSMADPDGEAVDLQLRSGTDYDAAGFVGRSERVVVITTTGDHLLTVGADDAEGTFAVAVGKDPSSGVATLRVAAVLAALVGVVVGTVCIVAGSRHRSEPHPATAAWPAATAWPAGGTQPPGWPGASSGPPAPWPTHPPTMPPPSPPGAPPASPPGGPPLRPPPASAPTGPPVVPPPPSSPSSPSTPSLPAPFAGSVPPSAAAPEWPPRRGDESAAPDGSTGDGERSPWAPPEER